MSDFPSASSSGAFPFDASLSSSSYVGHSPYSNTKTPMNYSVRAGSAGNYGSFVGSGGYDQEEPITSNGKYSARRLWEEYGLGPGIFEERGDDFDGEVFIEEDEDEGDG